jgi:hypothetical protein
MIRRCVALLDLTVVCARLGRDKVTPPLRTDPPAKLSLRPLPFVFLCFVLYTVFITYSSSARV